NETIDLTLMKEIYAYRLSSQTSSILHLLRYFIKMQIAPYSTEIFLWITSLLFLLAAAIFIGKTIVSKKEWQTDNQNPLLAVLLFTWWVATLFSSIGIPLLDELFTNATGNLPVLREIRRNIRYMLPLLWITFFWLIQNASIWVKNLKNNPISKTIQAHVILFSIVITTAYFYQVQPFSDPVIQNSIHCLQQGKLVCDIPGNSNQKVEFYENVCDIVQPDELIFPDPSPAYLGDSLIPRYYCMRSIAYSYKDGGNVNTPSMIFINEWWEISQQIEKLLPTSETPLNFDVLKIAQIKQADYFIFINPDPKNLAEFDIQQIVYQNDYGVLYKLP
nr:hypothetical protein [Anaerolineaceae bacterium]